MIYLQLYNKGKSLQLNIIIFFHFFQYTRFIFSPFFKLSEDDVIEIINLLQNSNESLRAIGRQYDIDNSITIRINSSKAWTNITSKYINEYPIRKKNRRLYVYFWFTSNLTIILYTSFL